jgi:hypothetical protein
MVSDVIGAKDAYRTKGTIQGTTGCFEYLGSKKRTKPSHAHYSKPRPSTKTTLKSDKGFLMIGKWRVGEHATYFSTSSIAALLLVCLRDRSTRRHCGSPSGGITMCGHVGREGL